MNCIDRLQQMRPDLNIATAVSNDCPSDFGIMDDPDGCGNFTHCIECWNREVKETAPKMKVMLDPGAKMPTRAHPADAGLDLHSMDCCTIMPGMSRKFDTGVHVAIPVGYVGMVKSKSGLNVNFGLTCEGVIDSGYTGSIVVKLFNSGRGPVLIETGMKIAQLVILPCLLPDLEQVDSLEKTERGDGGFGSTGAF